MDYLWSPWRYRYLTDDKRDESECIFCRMAKIPEGSSGDGSDEAMLVVYRSEHAFVVLNKFPYTSGHAMVVPYTHAAHLTEVSEPLAGEIMSLTRQAAGHIQTIYRPDGINIGMNIGAAAGAGVAGHIHMHVLPRWRGDANFMTTVGETRILPEELEVTWSRLTEAFRAKPVG